MGFGRRVCTAVATAVAFLICLLFVSAGSLWAGTDEDSRVMLFSGRDIWRNGAFAHGGFMFAPGGFEQDGLLLKILLSSGLYRYDSEFLGARVIGAEGLAQILPGWRIKRGNAEFKFFMGPEFQKHRLWPDDPTNHLRGNSFGLRTAVEIWYEPTPDTMVAADLSLSSIATSNSARAAYGWRVFDEMLGGLYVGPEIQYFGSDGYRHLRLGAHVTSLKTDDIEWSAAGGWAEDSQGRASPYLRLNLLKRQ
jgi:hypothetical protein